MFATTLTLAVLSCLSLTITAYPTTSKRGLPGAFYICTAENFSDNCRWVPPDNNCHIAGMGFVRPQSIGPDEGGYCLLYKDWDCNGEIILKIRFPGIGEGLAPFQGIQCYPDGRGPIVNGAPVGAPGSPFQVPTLP
ncbi:hypothetical protein GQ43DRAFT_479831 [Delitschia confertaspora ATCC 74209]|uniref:Uncharacterized protein n=1 Tax=Delitschia confertaspora ATCC 74209 TaxID=1513339 RepID=A0A9P4JSK9_9PLEO|nr:hypothetical protein GQ43DRAFT_479831 [Delitschia confertaspora ATCC 74209]